MTTIKEGIAQAVALGRFQQEHEELKKENAELKQAVTVCFNGVVGATKAAVGASEADVCFIAQTVLESMRAGGVGENILQRIESAVLTTTTVGGKDCPPQGQGGVIPSGASA